MTRAELHATVVRDVYWSRVGAHVKAKPGVMGTTKEEIERDVTAALRAIKEAGLVIVPREPTAAMIAAGVDYRLTTSLSSLNPWCTDTAKLYAVMIAASPMEAPDA